MKKKNTSLLLLFTLGLSAHAADWPRFRGPTANGFSPETGINTDWTANPPKTIWTVDLSDEGYACPSAAEGKVFILDHKEKTDIVRAIDLKKGNEVWRFTYEAGGKEDYGWARATPAYEDGKVYTVSRDGTVLCLDAQKGERIWRRDVLKDVSGKNPSWNVSPSPVIDGEKLIVSGGGKEAHMVALDKTSGKTIWTGGGTFKLGYATPVIATIEGKKQYLVFNAFGLTGMDAADGKLLWSTKWKSMFDVNAVTPIPLGKNRIYVSSGYGKGCGVYEIANNEAKQIWKNRAIPSQFNTAILSDGYIYGTSDPGYLVCLKADDGEVAWKQKFFQKGGLIAVDGHLIVMNGKQGDLALVELSPKAYKDKGRIHPLKGRSWSPPIISNKILVIRNREQLAAVDLSS